MSVIKSIKFDLPIGGIRAKTLEELTSNFTTEIIDLYKNGLLLRWVKSQGLTDHAQALNSLSPHRDDSLLLLGLCEIFNIAIGDQKLLSKLANHHVSGIKIDPEQLNYKDKYEALLSELGSNELSDELPSEGEVMGFDNEFVGREVDVTLLTRMHKLHTDEDIVLVPVWLDYFAITNTADDNDYSQCHREFYYKNVGAEVSLDDEIIFLNENDEIQDDDLLISATAPCDGIVYKCVNLHYRDLLNFIENSNAKPIVVAYLRVDI